MAKASGPINCNQHRAANPLHGESKSKLQVKDELSRTITPQLQHLEKEHVSVTSPEDALEALRSKPDLRLLAKILRWLTIDSQKDHNFTIKRPSSKTVQIIFVLVNDIVPDFWQLLKAEGASGHSKEKLLLVKCLRSVAGIGAVISRLRLLITQLKDSPSQTKVPVAARAQPMYELLEVLEAILNGEDTISSIWRDIDACIEASFPQFLQWKELLSLLASGRLLSIASEASRCLNDTNLTIGDSYWVGNGIRYSSWLGSNVQFMSKDLPTNDTEGRKALSQLFSKALNLGYKDQVIRTAFSDLLGGDEKSLSTCRALIGKLPALEQKAVLYSFIAVLSRRIPDSSSSNGKAETQVKLKALRGVSAIIAALVAHEYDLQVGLTDWLIGVSANATGESHMMHRAVIVVVSNDNERLLNALQKSFELFGDKLYIKHTPILHQEVTAQILLMLTGYVYRKDKTALVNLSRSSSYLNAITNRLAASSSRARFLGMIVGTAVSELIDAPDRRMNFGAEDLKSPDGLWYKGLTTINDVVGCFGDLEFSPIATQKATERATKLATENVASSKLTGRTNASSRILSIEEIGSSDSDEEDLPMYEKPGSDPSDEDEDPTLVQRDRPTPPVYIRDLIDGLRETENFDRHRISLINAANLIRRKAAFGSEVSDNIEELATLLVGLSDKWEMEDFQKSRLQGMIAVLAAEPLKMGQWFSKTFYNGDYSMGQRASVLTTLGMTARELAGLGKEDAALTGANPKETTFPSKRLPDRIHKIYALETAPLNTLSTQLEMTMIQPMAASAADQITGPNALKVRTFSSRMAVEKKRQKPIPNALAKVVAEGFFFPLTGRWRTHLQTYGENSSHTEPFLLAHLLKTLSLILHASGASTLSLPQMTAEFWDLLLSLRPRATDASVLEALLFAFLTLLDINENDQRRLAEEHAKELLETQGWVENVFERIGGGSEEGDRIRMLAAGVLLRTREVVEKYQRMLMGDMVDYM